MQSCSLELTKTVVQLSRSRRASQCKSLSHDLRDSRRSGGLATGLQQCSSSQLARWHDARGVSRALRNYPTATEIAGRMTGPSPGLSPRERRSGTSIHGRPRLCKTGNSRLRKALYMPAMVALRFNPTLRIFAERLLAAGKHKRLIIGAVMRKLLVLAYGILRSGVAFDANYA